MKGWWNKEAKATGDRKRVNWKQKNLARLAKRLGGRCDRE